MKDRKKITVLGGGSWATAIVKILLENVSPEVGLNWYMRSKESIEGIKKHQHNPRYLSSVSFDTEKHNIKLFNDINESVKDADILIFVIPSAFVGQAVEELKEDISDKFIVSAIKGIEPKSNVSVGEFLMEKFNIPITKLGVVSGPCHAEEVAFERLSYLTIACENPQNARLLANFFQCRFIKTTISDDIFGVEYSAVLKNIFAVAAGICHGLGYGDNFQSVLISNAIQEIKRFIDTVDPKERDIKNSVYLGDLLVTAYSQFSRNRTFGTMVGKGYSVKSAQLEMNMVAEGYYATKCIKEMNKKYNVNMPITDAIFNILYEQVSPYLEINILTENMR